MPVARPLFKYDRLKSVSRWNGVYSGADRFRSDEWWNDDASVSQFLTSFELAQFVDNNELKYLNSDFRQHVHCSFRAFW